MGRKNSIDFKLSIIQEYLNGDLGYHSLSAKHGIDIYLIRTWVNQKPSKKKQNQPAPLNEAYKQDH